ncbi:MAG: hypothetical protein MZV64_31805 [Ignavibacteriales bacterium]|nr:hypothetical protein [Ignavibacteriales bacterium]
MQQGNACLDSDNLATIRLQRESGGQSRPYSPSHSFVWVDSCMIFSLAAR